MKSMLGIIGGMGPQASELFYAKINAAEKAERDQDHINILLYSHAEIPDRSEYILSGRKEELWNVFAKDVEILKGAGCKYLAIPCNTSHYFANRFNQAMDGGFISMIDEAAAYAVKTGARKIGIAATDGTVQSDLYGKALRKYGAEPFYPCKEDQKNIMHIIYDEIKQGKKGNLKAFEEIGRHMQEAGCDLCILACTELSVLKSNYAELQTPYYLDAMDALTRQCVIKCGGSYCGNL